MTATLIPTLFDEDLLPFDRFLNVFNRRWQPDGLDCSIYENDTHYFVEAPVPGLALDDIKIKLDKGDLWISGESKREEKEDKSVRKYRSAASRFFYRIPLPDGIDLEDTPKAIYKQGMVTVQFEKKGGYQSKVIPIESQEVGQEEKQVCHSPP